MTTLVSYPSGYLGIHRAKAMGGGLAAVSVDEATRSYRYTIALWVLMTALGYFHWFYPAPRIYRKRFGLKYR